MAEGDTGNLFARAREVDPAFVPLAERMRPRSLDEVVGQDHLVGEGGLLRRASTATRVPSLLLWGPPGTGKTTIARILASAGKAFFEPLSATEAGVKNVRAAVDRARRRRDDEGRATVLFVDEIHRFNKGQQDALLSHVESGVCSLIGATTENPSFEVNAALLSRVRVASLNPVEPEAVVVLLRRALADQERGLGTREVEVKDEVLAKLGASVDGDARRALNALELAVDLMGPDDAKLDEELVARALGRKTLRYDRAGDEHYDLASALIKSLRASDPDAAAYWLARMLEGGETPTFVARRLVIFASEDVGNADPRALLVATAAAQAAHMVGMPEAGLTLTQAATFLALAPKSNAALRTWTAARRDVREHGSLPVPLDIRNAPTKLMKALGHGEGYRYPHDHPGSIDPEHESHLPEKLRDRLPERRYFEPGEHGWEAAADRRLREVTGTPPSSKDES